MTRMQDITDLGARSRPVLAGLHRTLQLLGRTLADVEADPTPGLSTEEAILLEDVIDLLVICEDLISRLRDLEQQEAEHAAYLSRRRLN